MTLDASTNPVDESIVASQSTRVEEGQTSDSGILDELVTTVEAIQARRIRFVSRGNRMPSAIGEDGHGAWKQLTVEEQAVLRRHRDALKDLVKRGMLPVRRAPEPATAPPSEVRNPEPTAEEPDPVIRVGGHQVTEKDALDYLDDAGLRAAYEAGRLSKAEAFEMAAVAMRQLQELTPRRGINRLSLTRQLSAAGPRPPRF